jgi:hypothetical protein
MNAELAQNCGSQSRLPWPKIALAGALLENGRPARWLARNQNLSIAARAVAPAAGKSVAQGQRVYRARTGATDRLQFHLVILEQTIEDAPTDRAIGSAALQAHRVQHLPSRQVEWRNSPARPAPASAANPAVAAKAVRRAANQPPRVPVPASTG